jgi:hypothetical protein
VDSFGYFSFHKKRKKTCITYPQPVRPNGSQPLTPPTHWPREERIESVNVMCLEKRVGQNTVNCLKPLTIKYKEIRINRRHFRRSIVDAFDLFRIRSRFRPFTQGE